MVPSDHAAIAERLLESGRHEEALAEADAAIAELLQPWISVEEFIRLSLRGAPAEGLLRYERGTVAELPHLHRPIVVRWEALRRSGRTPEAGQMREVCIRHFPERASVWVAAGNQALDEDQEKRANHYFQRCLQLAPDWTAGLVGMAIVLERRKEFQRALTYRERIVEVERALDRDDPPSLQRVVRYAAALARVGRWVEAGGLFRRVARLGAFATLPSERPVLLRVFSRELYSPTVLARMIGQAPGAVRQPPREVVLALREATLLDEVFRHVQTRAGLEPGERLALSGTCVWLAGDLPRAYALLDEAETHSPDELSIQHLLACAAQALGATELPGIVRFANQAAVAILEQARRGAVADEQVFYALVTLERCGAPGQARSAFAALPEGQGEFVGFYRDALAHAGQAPPTLKVGADPDPVATLRRAAAFRAAQLAVKRSPLDAAIAGHEALCALATDPADPASS